MGLLDVVVLAAVQGGAEALPVSATGHAAAARLWIGGDRSALALLGAAQLAAAAAMAFAARHRLSAALGEGLRAVARPSLLRTSPDARDAARIVVGSAVSLAVAEALRPFLGVASQAPIAVAVGLLATGAALGSTALAPPPWREGPSLAGIAVVGVAHGLGAAPGASRVGAALVLLLWLGVGPARAVDLALALSVPALAVEALHAIGQGGGDGGSLAAAVVVSFLCAALGSAALRSLAEQRRVAALALWVLPLGLAFFAYAQALSGFA